jgi:hypothetical protein
MSKTPETDSASFEIGPEAYQGESVVLASFSRTLEQENIEMKKLLEVIKEELKTNSYK